MSEKEKQVLNNLEKLIPKMTDVELAQLIGFGMGLAAREDRPENPESNRAALAGGPVAVQTRFKQHLTEQKEVDPHGNQTHFSRRPRGSEH